QEEDVHRAAIFLRRSPPPRRWAAGPRFARPEPAAQSTSRTPESTPLLHASIAARSCPPCATGCPAEERSSSRRPSLPPPCCRDGSGHGPLRDGSPVLHSNSSP